MATVSERAVAYRVGLCMASVCAPKRMPIEEVEAHVNADHPTGISSSWRLDDAESFRNGSPNPCPCEQDSGRVHWLLSC